MKMLRKYHFVVFVILGFYFNSKIVATTAATTTTTTNQQTDTTKLINHFNNNNNNNYDNQITNYSINDTKINLQKLNNPNLCSAERLVVYKVVLHTYWTRELFPKHYPDWRPTAQWTKTIGRSHDSSFNIFHIGQPASLGVKQFVETGKSDQFEQQQQQQQQQTSSTTNNNFNNIFDEFEISAILTGAGRNEAKFFVDGNHSYVSLMTRIVPSPDWFIGVDSFQLCIGGTWLDTVTVEMDPLDAGTDNGFTFTAPNWPTDPQGIIYRITSRYPGHPAGSFFYPKSKRLPPIATFQFIKLKEYEMSEVFNFEEDEHKYEMVKTQTHLESEHNHVEMNNELSASIEKERQNEVTIIPIAVTERERVRAKLLAKMNPTIDNNLTSSFEYSNYLPKNEQNAFNVDDIKGGGGRGGGVGGGRQQQHKRQKQSKHSRDCHVGHWSEWSPCSQTCGIGDMHRYRKIIRYAKRGGHPCPPLKESKWCGETNDCDHLSTNYFDWSNNT